MNEDSLFEIDCEKCQGPLEGNPEGCETLLGEPVYCYRCGWSGVARFKPEVERQIEDQMEKGSKRKRVEKDPWILS